MVENGTEKKEILEIFPRLFYFLLFSLSSWEQMFRIEMCRSVCVCMSVCMCVYVCHVCTQKVSAPSGVPPAKSPFEVWRWERAQAEQDWHSVLLYLSSICLPFPLNFLFYKSFPPLLYHCDKTVQIVQNGPFVTSLIMLLTVKQQRNILHEISKRKANWIGHILCRNCLLWQVIEGEIKGGIEVTGRRGRRCR
jgi:hypothetical protein